MHGYRNIKIRKVFIIQEINYGIYNYWNIWPDSKIDKMLRIYGSFGSETEF